MIYCKRVYQEPTPGDGYRVLVDRLWPRGVKKSDLQCDEWAKALAPSAELRKAFHGDVIDFTEFSRRYIAELTSQGDAPKGLADRAKNQTVTLLYGAKNTEQNHALVLADFLRRLNS